MPLRLSTSLLLLLFPLCTAASAQQPAAVRPIGDTPVEYLGEYHLASGSWSSAASRRGSRVLYNCTLPGGYYAAVGNGTATNADHLWIDEGKLADTNSARIDQLDGFDFAFCNSNLPPAAGLSFRIEFYADYLPCTAPPAATCSYVIDVPPPWLGYPPCMSVAVDLSGGFECSTDLQDPLLSSDVGGADRSFGWAFGSNPGLTGMNDAGPVLAKPCPTPRSGCLGSNGFVNAGNEDQFYWHDPAGVWTGCYWFSGPPYASFSMRMLGGAKNAFAYGHVNNSLGLASTDFAAGTSVTFTVSGHGAGSALYLLASPAPGSIVRPVGELVVSTNFYPGVPFAMYFATGSLTIAVPPAVAVAYVQAVETTGPAIPSALVALSNGLCCVR